MKKSLIEVQQKYLALEYVLGDVDQAVVIIENKTWIRRHLDMQHNIKALIGITLCKG